MVPACPLISFFIILQDKGIAGRVGQFQRALHGRFLVDFEHNLQIIIAEFGETIFLGHGRIFQVQSLFQRAVLAAELIVNALQSLCPAHGADFFHGLAAERIADEGQLGIEHRVHLAESKLMFNLHVSYRQHAAGKILRRRNGALHGVGIETHFAIFRQIVFCHEAILYEALAEILPHHGFELTAPQG